ncbi:helix-turn-helix transcriptional regulator [Lactobacillus psittaci]|uniref:HTH araC/xylS-type domain-containing protein n=1 Tax=Lactobacillus psittaci DSM 15354 TaxID=1122152 RepID=A0A0R1RY57_9LACO|nr:helix-turn-helix transcriptional regulator [Lactobacillus psittaci]KRL61916.1 hypothetical protein FC23_GL000414 [Lactobacillus psittaci DSM 15354]
MAILALGEYLKGMLKRADDKNEIRLKSKNAGNDFAIYLENHNGGIHRYLSQGIWLFLENGTASVNVNKQVINLNRGNILYLKPGIEFEIMDQTAETLIIKLAVNHIFNPENKLKQLPTTADAEAKIIHEVQSLLQNNGYLLIKTTRLMKESQLIDLICNEYLNSDLFMREIIIANFSILLASCLRMESFNRQTNKRNQLAGTELDQYIDMHFADINLKGAAEYFGFNTNYFSSIVKQKTGKSFVEHVDERRMQEAKRLLAQPNLSLQDIVTRVGYSSKSFFYKKFNQYYGTTPAMMREELFRQANINLK